MSKPNWSNKCWAATLDPILPVDLVAGCHSLREHSFLSVAVETPVIPPVVIEKVDIAAAHHHGCVIRPVASARATGATPRENNQLVSGRLSRMDCTEVIQAGSTPGAAW